MQRWPDLRDYYKFDVLFPFVDHWLQEVDSRFSQRCNEHWALTVSIDNIPWSKWNSQLLTKNPYCEGILPFLSRGSKVEKFFEIIPLEERAATANSDWTAGCLQPSDISSYSQDYLPFLLLYPREVFLVNAPFLLWDISSSKIDLQTTINNKLEDRKVAIFVQCCHFFSSLKIFKHPIHILILFGRKYVNEKKKNF